MMIDAAMCLLLATTSFVRPETTRRYVHPPLSERVAVYFREGIADPCGLYQRHTSPRPELGRDVWYTTWSEYQFACGWLQVGRKDLARKALDALLAYSVTDEGYVGERIHEKSPWFFPWSPNASGSGRILNMLLDLDLADTALRVSLFPDVSHTSQPTDLIRSK